MMTLSRRLFIKSAGGTIATAAGFFGLVDQDTYAHVLDVPVGLALYTIKDELQRDLEGVLRKVAVMGFREVEYISLPGRTAAEVRLALDSAGLRAISVHVSATDLLANLGRKLEEAQVLGARYVICPFPHLAALSHPKDLTLDDWRRNAEFLNGIGGKTQKANLQFGYHNHNMEFRRFGRVVAYDELLRLTDPELVTMELDCGWVVNAGADPAYYLSTYPGRFQLLHLKDLKRGSVPTTELEIMCTEVGGGIIDWRRIFAVARKGGVKHCFIGQDPPFERSSLESVKLSYAWLQGLSS